MMSRELLALLESNSLTASLLAAFLVGVVSWLLISRSKSSVLDESSFRSFTLAEKETLTHNTRIFRFSIGEGKRLNLPIGKHVVLSCPAGTRKEDVIRKYTPITSSDTVGYFDLLIKIYPAPGGLMGRYLDGLPIGSKVPVRGPHGSFEFGVDKFTTLAMLAGGTGITPMWQVLSAILSNPDDNTHVKLIFANVSADDIILRDKLEELAKAYPSQFKLFFVLNEPPADGWSGGVGFVSEQHIRDHIGLPEEGKQVLLCGPLPMNSAMRKHLMAIGYTKTDIFAF